MTKALDKMIKDGLLLRGDDEKLSLRRLPSGIPPLDLILGGGWPYARVTMLVGPESTGKTLLAQYAVAAQQKDEKAPHALLVDAELSYDASWWAKSGVDVAELMVCQPQTGETAINLIKEVMDADEQLGIIVVDSIGALTPAPILERAAEDKTMGLRAQLVNVLLSKVAATNRNAILLLINQLRANLRGHEESYPGGMGLLHWAHIILRTRREGWIKEGDKRVGFTLEVLCKKNKTSPPQGYCQIPFYFTGQIDMLQAFIDEALDMKLIRQNPPYYYFPDDWGGQKFLGKNNLRQHLLDNSETLELLKQAVAGHEIIKTGAGADDEGD